MKRFLQPSIPSLLLGCSWLLFSTPHCSSGSSSAAPPGGASGSPNHDASTDAGSDGMFILDGSTTPDVVEVPCTDECPTGTECVQGKCLPPQNPCTSHSQCDYDSYCNGQGKCVPYGSLPDDKDTNDKCKLTVPPEAFAPSIKCEFREAPADDPFPAMIQVRTTPMVASLDANNAEPPSIVASFGGYPLPEGASCSFEDCYYRYGVIRILKGTDCSLQATLGGVDLDPVPNGKKEWARSSSPVALADLDGDGAPEIIAYMVEEHLGAEVLVAFKRTAGAWAPLWTTGKAVWPDGSVFNANLLVTPAGGNDWSGPSIHDVDDDPTPEIIREAWVIDGKTGVVQAAPPADYQSYHVGTLPVLANLDDDPAIELTNGDHVWEFDAAGSQWVTESWYGGNSSGSGWSAVADFNPYDGLGKAEIVVVRGGQLAIFNADHTVFHGMSLNIPSGGGGPPTVADYDGDNLPEVGVAGCDYYTVYDPDCQDTPRTGGKCASRNSCDFGTDGACPNGVLWARKSQDHSSCITGSSVFDFEADGKAEVVYADECFTRVYAGESGKVIFSQYRSSSTWLENPVVADVDGDYRAELVVPANGGTSFTAATCAGLLNTDQVETFFAGLICDKNSDCLSGVCDQGLCRCTTSSQCCSAADDATCVEYGYKCAAPPAGTPGTGNTCRASYPHGWSGIRVYEDSKDRWVRSRTIWNQHAYAVTNVNDNGSIPPHTTWLTNWKQSTLNNFRQNTPGEADGTAIGDLTAQVTSRFTCEGQGAVLVTPVCNRGTAAVGPGVPVAFYDGETLTCKTTTTSPIEAGACIQVSCTWTDPPRVESAAIDLRVVIDEDSERQECIESNNTGLLLDVFCQTAR